MLSIVVFPLGERLVDHPADGEADDDSEDEISEVDV
jgi:hypothetical protein